MAEAYLPRLKSSGLLHDAEKEAADQPAGGERPSTQSQPAGPQPAQDLRQAVKAFITAYGRMENGDSLELASPQEAAEKKAKAIGALGEIPDKTEAAAKLLAGDNSDYGEVFRKLAGDALARVQASKQAWSSMNTDTRDGVGDGAARVRQADDDLAEMLADLETLVSPAPWQVGLAQAELAKMLAVDGADLTGEGWYGAIKAVAEQKGQEAMTQARWHDALQAYRGLSDLDPDSKVYLDKLKTARRHVRILVLYGNGGEPVGGEPPEEKTTWRDLLSEVEVNMVKTAIAEISNNYVTDVDHQRLGLAGLDGLQVLAETPQAARAFPGLASQEKRQEFINAIGRERQAIKSDSHVDQIHLRTALDSLLWASERTVKIPWEVITVEFAEAMLDELDPFSAMIWPHDAQDFLKQTSGKFYGVGIQITKDPGESLKVVTPLADTPAFRAGIKTGDTIVAVDGQRTDVLNIEKLIRMITGEKGSKVVLSIQNPGMAKPKDYAITRDEIRIKTVKGWRSKPDGNWDYMIDPDHRIGYVRITQFTEETVADIDQALSDLAKQGARSLVLDLRFNPGGLLQSATATADEFLRSGTLVSTKVRQATVAEFEAHPDGQYLDGDIAVLVNQVSASAAEIVSGALKDRKRAIIVGERTFGKGSVQHVITIKDKKAYLKLTAAYYYLPSGRLLHRENGSKSWGVDPDVKIQLTPRQTRRWLDLQRKTDLLQEVEPDKLSGDLAKQFQADVQLNTAVVLLRVMQLNQVKAAA